MMRKKKKAAAQIGEIKVGDKFLWHLSPPEKGNIFGYGTSGTLPRKYMAITGLFGYGDKVLTVCHIQEGQNGHGKFLDYYLNDGGDWNGKGFGNFIINEKDARRMERAEGTR